MTHPSDGVVDGGGSGRRSGGVRTGNGSGDADSCAPLGEAAQASTRAGSLSVEKQQSYRNELLIRPNTRSVGSYSVGWA